ncbi:hypothetical protein [Methyloceanibacter stevinii]
MAKEEKTETDEAAEAAPAKPAVTMIHVRFSADGSVSEIGERPTGLTPQDWFNRLSDKAGTKFQPLSGGRGIFRLPPEEVEVLKTMTAN